MVECSMVCSFINLCLWCQVPSLEGLYEWDMLPIKIYYRLGKGGYVFGSVGLFVCLSVDNITQKVMDRLR